MKVEIVLGDEFKRQFKRLAKKYPSLKDDFITFKKELADDPFQGSDLGNGTRKVRMLPLFRRGKARAEAPVLSHSMSFSTKMTLLR